MFSNIFRAYGENIRHHIACEVDDEDEVSDLVSEVFSLAWIKLDERAPLALGWLLRVADNKLRDRSRNLRARDRAIDAIQLFSRRRFQDLLDSLAVRQAIDLSLTPRERRIVNLFYWDRLSAGEIASLVGCSQAAVFTTLSRARSKLGAELSHDRSTYIARTANT